MPGSKKRFRLTVHIEGREGGEACGTEGARPADFETILTTELRGEVSRERLLQQVCECVCGEGVLHENSTEVASRIDAAMHEGVVLAAPRGTQLPLAGRATSANLQLAVTHTVAHGDVRVAFGALCVAVPAALIHTVVNAVRVESAVGDQQYVLTAQLTPAGCCAYAECYQQAGCECAAVKNTPRALPTARAQPGTLSHRNHSFNCQEAHARNVLHAARIPVAEQAFGTREVLSRKVARLSTPGWGAETVHTVFFR